MLHIRDPHNWGSSLDTAIRISAIISALTSFIMIVFYIFFPNLRNRSAKLIIWLAFSNLLLSLSVSLFLYMPQLDFPTANNAFAFIINFHILANVFWSCAMSKTMSTVILERDRLFRLLSTNPHSPKRLAITRMAKFHLLTWIGALAFSLVPLLCDAYESYRHTWYWYRLDFNSQILCWTCYILPIVAGTSYNIYILLSLDKAKHSMRRNELYDALSGETLAGELYSLVMALKNYPLVSAILSLLSLVLQLVFIASDGDYSSVFGLFVLTGVAQMLQGLLCFVVYMVSAYKDRRRRAQHRMTTKLQKKQHNDLIPKDVTQLNRYSENDSQEEVEIGSQLILTNSATEEFDPGMLVECLLDSIWRCFCCHSFHVTEYTCDVMPTVDQENQNSGALFRSFKSRDESSTYSRTGQSYHDKLLGTSYSNALHQGTDHSFSSGHSIFSNDGRKNSENEPSTINLFESLLLNASLEERRQPASSTTSIGNSNSTEHQVAASKSITVSNKQNNSVDSDK